MKIVFSTDNYWPRVSGMAVSIDTFATELCALGHEVHVLAPDYPGAKELNARPGPARVHRFRSMELFFSAEDRLVSPRVERSVWQLLDVLQPDVVHTQTEMLMGRAAWRWAKANEVPLVMTAHTHWASYIDNYLPFLASVSQPLVRGIMRSVYAQADVVVTPSPHMREVLRSYGIGPDIEVLPTGVQQGLFAGIDRARAKQSSVLFEEFPQLQARTVLLTVGRVAHEKNLGLMLDVVARLVRRHPRLTWLVVGDGPTLGQLKADAKARGLADHLVTTGYLDRSRVKHAFALADVFCLASKTETQGLVTVEALATGLPVVAVDAMGSHDVLEGERGGFLSPDEPSAFAERVERLLTDTLLHRRTSRDAVAAAARFAPRALTERLVEAYRAAGACVEPRRLRVAAR